jgi:hypothetical protein
MAEYVRQAAFPLIYLEGISLYWYKNSFYSRLYCRLGSKDGSAMPWFAGCWRLVWLAFPRTRALFLSIRTSGLSGMKQYIF